jgi:hypothetical protein
MPHRRKRRSKKSTLGKKGRSRFVGVAALMLVGIVCVIVPSARHQNIALGESLDLALLLWACSVFFVWACLRSRRRRYSHSRSGSYATHTNYGEFGNNVSNRPSDADEHADWWTGVVSRWKLVTHGTSAKDKGDWVNTTTSITNADGSIITIMKVHHSSNHAVLLLALLAVIFIGSGLYLLLRKEKPPVTTPIL